MESKRLAIIGGGPKAAAIAAKVHCLKQEFEVPLHVTIFEPVSIGAAWSGKCGYTDGKQRLCTPAEKDVGFPYSPDAFGAQVVERMFRQYSWSSYLLSTGRYSEWVDRGRQRPLHSDFADYLAACIAKSGAVHRPGRVIGMKPKGSGGKKKWVIKARVEPSGDVEEFEGFDGVIVTGPGQVTSKFKKVSDPRVLDGVNFWSNLGSVEGMLEKSDEPVIILGSGGTAAAIAGWMASNKMDNEILIMGTQVSLFARVENSFENAAFTDQKQWASLSFDDRKKFTERLTRGAVWSTVIDILSDSRNVSYLSGRADEVTLVDDKNIASDILVKFTTSSGAKNAKTAHLVIDATGFDSMWFADLLPPKWGKFLRANAEKMQDEMSPSLELPTPDLPRLHAPMLSPVVSPAFTSLMALGDMSDAVLRPYLASS